MRIAVSGTSGLVGRALRSSLETRGWEVLPMVRSQTSNGQIHWDPASGRIDAKMLEGLDAVVHLAGDSIADGRWNASKKQRIRDSRVRGTTLISEALAKLESKPNVFVCASAIGYYGSHREEPLDESASGGDDFLAEVCQAWEAACEPATKAGIRTVNARFGMILSPAGGALAKMLPPFKLGLGGVVGSGRQVWSWVSLDDAVRAILHAIDNDSVRGAINVTAPYASTNREFTKALGHVLGRPTLAPLPGFVARLAFGEMANALLLGSARVKPTALVNTGFAFKHEHLEPALRDLLK